MGLARSLDRYEQLTELYAGLSSRHASLQAMHESTKQQMIEFKTQANYWEEQFSRAKKREDGLKAEIDELKAQLKKREQQLFGKKSEKLTSKQDCSTKSTIGTKKKRGQQPGSEGHGRRDYSHLPAIEEVIDLKEQFKKCRCCGLSYEELPGTEDSEVLEVINVSAHRRKVRRKKYKRCCQCESNSDSQIVTAPPFERLIPKSKLGISIWALLLINKYEYQQPVNRTLEQLSNHGLSLAMGTVTDGLQKLVPFFMPIYDAIINRSIAAKHWHADETGWKVFEAIEGKKNYRWFLWIFHNKETVVYKISPSRSSKVLNDYFGKAHPGGILNVDRYGAYKVIAKNGLFILAFCWSHVRRDFLEYAKAYDHQEAWAISWVDRIGKLYHINNQRINYRDKSRTFRQHDKQLKNELSKMETLMQEQRNDVATLSSAKKILDSLHEHWDGLTVFADYPDIPMDNNQAERGLRGSVVGRKNYYGSGAVWSAQLAAVLFTIFETMKLWKVNPHTWLLAYLQECAMYDGSPPDNVESFLPWAMKPNLLELFSRPPVHENANESLG